MACGYPDATDLESFGLLSIKSLLMARAHTAAARRRYAFHVVTSASDSDFFNSSKLNFDVARMIAADPLLALHVHPVGAVDAAVAAWDPALPLARELGPTVFKTCAAARLKFPFFFHALPPAARPSRLLYLDWDTVVQCDLTALWDGMGGWAPEAVLGMALNDPTGLSSKDTYRATAARPAAGGVSSGVLLFRLDRLWARGGALMVDYWRALAAVVAERVDVANSPAFAQGAKPDAGFWALTEAFPLGDQDMLNALLARDGPLAGWLQVLPDIYNWCLADLVPPRAADAAGWARPAAPPCVVHFCGGRLEPTSTMVEEGDRGGAQHEAARHLYAYYRDVVTVDAMRPPNEW